MEVSWNGPRVGQHERLSCLWCRGGARQLGVSPWGGCSVARINEETHIADFGDEQLKIA